MKKAVSAVLTVVVVLCLSAFSSGQTASQSSVVCWVSDPAGAGLPNATVTLVDTNRGITLRPASDAKGAFTFANVDPGTLELRASATGFADYRQQLTVNVGRAVNVRVAMQIKSATEAVEVSSTASNVDTTSSTIDKVIGATEIANLPLNGRNYLELALLVPGNSLAPSFDPTKSHTVLISSAGQLGRGGNVTVDGADNNDDVVGGSLVNIPQDAVAEFQTATNRFSAALGRSGSSVINVVTRGGTNTVHGSVSFFERITYGETVA